MTPPRGAAARTVRLDPCHPPERGVPTTWRGPPFARHHGASPFARAVRRRVQGIQIDAPVLVPDSAPARGGGAPRCGGHMGGAVAPAGLPVDGGHGQEPGLGPEGRHLRPRRDEVEASRPDGAPHGIPWERRGRNPARRARPRPRDTGSSRRSGSGRSAPAEEAPAGRGPRLSTARSRAGSPESRGTAAIVPKRRSPGWRGRREGGSPQPGARPSAAGPPGRTGGRGSTECPRSPSRTSPCPCLFLRFGRSADASSRLR